MAEFSWTERLLKTATAPVVLGAWWFFAPDFSVFSTPLGQLSLAELAWPIGYLIGLLPLLYLTISWLYEAITGRDSVWLWHP